MSLWDDLGNFGSGLLDTVGEGLDGLVQNAVTDDKSANAGTTQQPEQPVKDNHGNAVTTPQAADPKMPQDKTLTYIGLGLGGVAVLGVLMLAMRK